jgi:hypothetical protein
MGLSKAQKEGKVIPITFWVSKAERATLDREAKKQHRSRSSLMKQLVFDGLAALKKGK